MKKPCEFHSVLFLALLITFLPWLRTTHVQPTSIAQGTPTIYLQPTENVFYTNQTLVDGRFNVTIWVRDAPPIVAWQVYMEFKDSVINVTRWIEPATDPQYVFYWKTTSANPTPPDSGYVHLGPSTARVQVGGALWPPGVQEPASGNGKLCIFEFNITRYPTSGTISSLLHINATDTYLLDPDVNEVNPIIKEDGSFDYVLGTVPTLRLVGKPQFIQFTPYQNVAGCSFNTIVSVDGPASVAGLNNVSFTLSYDSSLLSTSESNVILNSIWTGPRNISIDAGRVTIAVSNPSLLPSEPTVVICTIAFTIHGQQSVPPKTLGDYVDSGINFTSSTLLNSAGDTIDEMSSSNQTIRIYAYQTETTVLEITQPAILSTSTTIQKNTLFAVNVSVTDVYNPSLIQVELLYDQSIIISTGEVTLTGEVASDHMTDLIFEPGLIIARVSISGHINPIISGPIIQFEFRAVTENATSYLNFSKPYGQDTFIQDSSGAIANATYLETTIHISETPRPHLVLESSQTRLNTTVKTQCSFELTVKNEGNVEAKNVSLSSYGVLSSWVQFSEDGFSLALDSMKNVNVTVTPTYTGEFNLTIAVASTEGSTANATLTLSISESAANPPWELIVPAIIIGIGIVATITLITVKSRRRKKTRLVRT